MYRLIIAISIFATMAQALPTNATVRMATEGYVTNKVATGVASAVAQAGTNATAIASAAQSNAVAFASTNPVYKVYAPGSSTEWIDGAGNKYVVSNFWNMTFSADFGREGSKPAQTNYLFTSYTQYYFEGYAWAYWRMRPYEVVRLPSNLTSPSIWNATTNQYVLDPVPDTGASGHAYISYWTTTNLVGTFALESSLTAGLAGKVSTNDVTYTQTVAKASTALQPDALTPYYPRNNPSNYITLAQVPTEADPFLSAQNSATKELTGFADPSAVTISYDRTARTMTVTQSGGVNLWWRGTNLVLTSPWTSLPHDDTAGRYYLSMRSGTNATWSTDAWTFDMLQIAYANYTSANDAIGFRENHGLMQWQVHETEHRNTGSYRVSGLAPIAGTYVLQSAINSNNTPSFAGGVIQDEDNPTTIAQWDQDSYTLLSFTNSTSTAVFHTNSPYLLLIGATYPLVNTAASNFTQTVSARYLNVYQMNIPVSSDSRSQLYRMAFVQPQVAHSSLAAAQAEDFRSINLGTFTSLGPEFVPFCKITFHVFASYTSTGKCRIESVAYLTGSQASLTTITQLTAPSSADAISVAATPSNYTTEAGNVEEHLKGVDAKFGSFNVMTNQTWGAIGTNATYRMSWDVTNMTFKVEEILP